MIANHVFKQFHLFDFLKAALTDGLVRRLRCDQQHGRVVPISGFNRCDEVGDARTVLSDGHGHFAGRACVAVRDHAAGCFMGTIPELDARSREQVRDWHHGRANDPEGVVDAVHLKDFYKGLFGGHFHSVSSLKIGERRRAIL